MIQWKGQAGGGQSSRLGRWLSSAAVRGHLGPSASPGEPGAVCRVASGTLAGSGCGGWRGAGRSFDGFLTPLTLGPPPAPRAGLSCRGGDALAHLACPLGC